MPDEITIDLKTMVVAAAQKLVASGAIEKAIEKQLAVTVKDILESAMRSYSEFGKGLTNAIVEKLKINVEDLGIPGYNLVVLNMVRARLEQHMHSTAKDVIDKHLTELLKDPPKEIKLSELVDRFKKWANSHRYLQSKNSDTVSIVFDTDRSYGSSGIGFDVNPNKQYYGCGMRLAFDKDGKVWGLWLDGKDVKEGFFVGRYHGFEQLIFQLWAGGSKIIVDTTSIDDYLEEEPNGND